MSGVTAAQLLTADQLAARWQVPPSHVYRLTREDRIPVVKLGRYYRYRLDAIERFELGELDAATKAASLAARHEAARRSWRRAGTRSRRCFHD